MEDITIERIRSSINYLQYISCIVDYVGVSYASSTRHYALPDVVVLIQCVKVEQIASLDCCEGVSGLVVYAQNISDIQHVE